jgi:hypothetical protein
MLLPPFHMDAVRVIRTVPFAGFFVTGNRRLAGELFSRFFYIAPVRYRVRVSLVVHAYPSLDKGFMAENVAGESEKFPAIIEGMGK